MKLSIDFREMDVLLNPQLILVKLALKYLHAMSLSIKKHLYLISHPKHSLTGK